MITYIYSEMGSNKPVRVLLDGEHIGKIQKDKEGFRYYPKDQKIGGEAFQLITECQRSLERE